MERRKRLKAVIAVVAGIAVGLLANVTPAFAAGAGVSVGHSTITAQANPTTPLCIRTVANPQIFLTNVGTIGVIDEDTGTPAEYAGPSEAVFNLEHFYFGPQGTFADDGDPTCDDDPPGLPEPVQVDRWSLQGSNGVQTVECKGDEGTYLRVTNVYTIEVSGECTISGTPVIGSVTGPVTFVFSGNQNPCLPPVGNCDGALDDTEFEGVYTQTPQD